MAKHSSRCPSALASKQQQAALIMSTYAMYAHNDPVAGRKPGTPAATPSPTQSPAHSIVWIDGIGGYLLWDKSELVLGQAFAESHADVGIVGDLSRRAAVVRRLGSDYLVQPLQPTRLNGVAIDRPQLLRDGAIIELGSSVKIRFRRPNALSGTARLEMASIHRWKPTVDAILLLADCGIIGPRAGSHIACPDWRNEVLLIQKAGQWHLRTTAEVQVGGQPVKGQFPIGAGTHVRGDDFSLSFE